MIEIFINKNEEWIKLDTDTTNIFNSFVLNMADTDVNNPTAIFTNYSKTFTLPGTKHNISLLDFSYRFESIVSKSKQYDCLIKNNGFLFDRGFIRINNITNNKGVYTYSATFYSRLNLLFDKLKYNEDGTERKISDLYYGFVDEVTGNTLSELEESNYKIEWTAQYIHDSWDKLRNQTENQTTKYVGLNITAAPTYSGFHDDYANDKVLVYNPTNKVINTFNIQTTDTAYSNGWCLFTMPREVDQHEMRDLRANRQKTAIKTELILDAITNPNNNGGYKIIWDEAFSDKNSVYYKYYHNTWLIGDQLYNAIKNGEISSSTKMLELGIGQPSLTYIQPGHNNGDACVYASTIYAFEGNVEPDPLVKPNPSDPSTWWYDYSVYDIDMSDYLTKNIKLSVMPNVNIWDSIRYQWNGAQSEPVNGTPYNKDYLVFNGYSEYDRMPYYGFVAIVAHVYDAVTGGQIDSLTKFKTITTSNVQNQDNKYKIDRDYTYGGINRSWVGWLYSYVYAQGKNKWYGGEKLIPDDLENYLLYTFEKPELITLKRTTGDRATAGYAQYEPDHNVNIEWSAYELKDYGKIKIKLTYSFISLYSYNQGFLQQSVDFLSNTEIKFFPGSFVANNADDFRMSGNQFISVQWAPLDVCYSQKNTESNKVSILYEGGSAAAITSTFTKKELLNTIKMTPLDCLLSFTKLLNLKYYYDKENVYIYTPEKYYLNEIVDIDSMINYNANIQINFDVNNAKNYIYTFEESGTYMEYLYDKKSKNKANTITISTDSVNKDDKKVLENVKFNTVLPYLMNSPYFNPNSLSAYPILSGVFTKYNKFVDTELKQDEQNVIFKGNEGIFAYDTYDKLCFFDNDNKPINDKLCLAFLNGWSRQTPAEYDAQGVILTDDYEIMQQIVGKSCHINLGKKTSTTRQRIKNNLSTIALNASILIEQYIPMFETIDGSGEYTTMFSMPDVKISRQILDYGNSQSLYNLFWENETNELYDSEQREVKLSVRFNNVGNINDLLRRFYKFNNCLWKLNKVEDLKTDHQSQICKCTFIKVKNINNWKNSKLNTMESRMMVEPQMAALNSEVDIVENQQIDYSED